MNTTLERVLSLRVSDVMSRDLATVSANSTMAEAAQVLCSKGVSGAPVVDELGHCVGILSTRDFAERDRLEGSDFMGASGFTSHELVRPNSNVPNHLEQIREDSVRRHMQPAIQTVSGEASVVNAARIMCSEHIHRLVVLDETSHPVGVASSLDLLNAIAHKLKVH
jgi:CBS-domain-containing membrane protein